VREQYYDALASALQEIAPDRTLEIKAGPARPAADYDPDPAPTGQIPLPCTPAKDRWSHCAYTFERFVVGASNAFAYELAQGLVRGDDQIEALFLLAGTGLGKTHLGTAVAHAVKTRAPNLRVECLGAEKFVNEMIRAIQAQAMAAFQEKYQRADLLVLEEVHFVGGKERTQREVAGVLDCLMDHRCRVVMSSVLSPADIPNLRSSLKSRFHQAILAEVKPPDEETRGKIFRQRAQEAGFVVPEEVVDLLVEKTPDHDVRALEGMLKQLRARSDMLKEKLTPRIASEVLELYGARRSGSGMTLRKILDEVCRAYHLPAKDAQARGRQKIQALARGVYCFLCREHTQATLQDIGALINRNHATVIYAIERIGQRIQRDEGLRKQVMFLSERLNGKC
jgi:chromosomal replication initiator protein